MDKRIEELAEQIAYHNNRYYNMDSPEISDVEYDILVKQLRALDPSHPVLNDVGRAVYGQKFTHGTVMGSLAKCHDPAEIVEKLGQHSLILMPKIDGCSLALHYEKGRLVRAVTRGDGYVGELVTENAKVVEGIPLEINDKRSLEIRGEAYIPKGEFYGTMDQPGYAGFEKGLANPRNAAAGALRQKDSAMTKERKVHFVAYKLLGEGFEPSLASNIESLGNLGFNEVPFWLPHSVDLLKIKDVIFRAEATTWAFDIDGVVAVIDDQRVVEELGYSGKCPKGAIAFKFETEKKRAVIKDIVWQTGRTGKITPVATIDPTAICGSTVARITLHNLQWLKKADIAIGDTVLFEKANEIIPEVVEVLERQGRRDINYPFQCPSCEHSTEEDGADIVCVNPACFAQAVQHLRFILETLGVKGMDVTTLQGMLNYRIVREPWTIFDITIDELVESGYGKTESAKWIAALSNVQATPEQVLTCLGIEGWGETMFENLFAKSKISGHEWIGMFNSGEIPARYLTAVAEAGPVRSRALLAGIHDKHELLKELTKRIAILCQVVGKLTGKSFCVTGTLSKGRKEIQAMIKAAGGIVKDSVSKDLSFLVVGDDAGSKLEKATKIGIPTLTEQQLLEML